LSSNTEDIPKYKGRFSGFLRGFRTGVEGSGGLERVLPRGRGFRGEVRRLLRDLNRESRTEATSSRRKPSIAGWDADEEKMGIGPAQWPAEGPGEVA
jgi:hypothetical protein